MKQVNPVQKMIQDKEKLIREREVAMMSTVDNISKNVANKLGLDYVPWFTLT